MCGEKYVPYHAEFLLKGSPPRVRGKAQRLLNHSDDLRITPACAGKSKFCRLDSWPERDHPRVCGEKKCKCGWYVPYHGSPPRVRGKEDSRRAALRPSRITPACAGKRTIFGMMAGYFRDHPRVCGEKEYYAIKDTKVAGSPPRVRGKAGRLQTLRRWRGITPACAGKSATCPAFRTLRGDHPRVCGEKACGRASPRGVKGSPPRVRGKVATWVKARMREGITPACAGKSP